VTRLRSLAESRILALALHHSTSEVPGTSPLVIGPAVLGLRVLPVPEHFGVETAL